MVVNLFSYFLRAEKAGMRGRWELSDAQWQLIEPILRSKRRSDGRGRPWQHTRAVLNGILWVLGTRAQWRELPNKYPPYQTCHRRFQQWVREGNLEDILRVLAEELHARGKCSWRRLSSSPPSLEQKGGLAVGPTKRGKGTKIIALADDHGLPLAVSVECASPHESQLVEGVLGHSFLDALPARLIGDKAYDGDRLNRDLAERYGIEMIAPHRGKGREPTQDGRPLRRYRTRWRVERLFACLHYFRRLVIRWGVPRRELLRHGSTRLHANLAQTFVSHHSYRNATMGSTLEARRAGR
jgi:transposase